MNKAQKYMTSRNLDLTQAAARVGVTYSTYQRWVSRKPSPVGDKLLDALELLDYQSTDSPGRDMNGQRQRSITESQLIAACPSKDPHQMQVHT